MDPACRQTVNRRPEQLVLLVFISLFAMVSIGEEIYKTVDEEGNVTYSTTPPSQGQDAQVLDTLPEPSEEDVQAARDRQQKISEDLEARSAARVAEAEARAREQSSGTTTIISSPGVIPVPVYHPGYRRPYYRPRPPHARPPYRPRPPASRPKPVPY